MLDDTTHTNATGIVRKDGIEALCGHRARALELYALAVTNLREARAAHARACVGNSYPSSVPVDKLSPYRDDDFIREARELVDRDIWKGLLSNSPLGSLMDTEERKLFDESLKNPPEVTPETVFATMDQLRSQGAFIFRRGLVNAFQNLSRKYKSHDGFKIGDRLILEWIVDVTFYGKRKFWTRLYSQAESRLRDIDRVFHVLDGHPGPDYQQGLCAAIRTAMGATPIEWQVRTPYFHVKWHKNGNAHFAFLRRDLVTAANRLIAEHYGMAVGAASHVAPHRHETAPPPPPALDDFFATPAELVARMVAVSGIESGHRVLEPSAGEGALASALATLPGVRLTCYEAHPARVATLRDTLPANVTTFHLDFLRTAATPEYDCILMNPPFSRGADTLHVAHALACLAPGGRLVAIMSAGITFRSDIGTTALRRQIEALDGIITALPSGTFKDVGTMVNTVMLIVDKPRQA